MLDQLKGAWTRLTTVRSYPERVEELKQKMRDREVAELEMTLLLTPTANAPDAPLMMNAASWRTFLMGTGAGMALTLLCIIYGSGWLRA